MHKTFVSTQEKLYKNSTNSKNNNNSDGDDDNKINNNDVTTTTTTLYNKTPAQAFTLASRLVKYSKK
jgi:hypothetical protein